MKLESELLHSGDDLPCHKENIIHTEQEAKCLRVWYVEGEKMEIPDNQ